MKRHKTLVVGTLAVVSALTGCTELRRLGVSGEVHPIHSEDSALAVARHSTQLSFAPGETLLPGEIQLPKSPLGDIDGDGLDDLLIGAWRPGAEKPGQVADMTAYLFYGRGLLPEQLTYADADATFESGQLVEMMSLGDVNGDSLSDFVLGDKTGYEIVFGSPKRYAGHYAKFSAGHKLVYGPDDGGQTPLRFYRTFPVGDVNGDGADDFVIQASLPNATTLVRRIFNEYLIEGRTGDWPSGPWDWSSAAAVLAADIPSESAPKFGGSGDFDGDGYADLLTWRDEQCWLFYGGPRGLHGALAPSVADATFEAAQGAVQAVGDVDGDGADDLQIYTSSAEIQIVYGSSVRYSGVVSLKADLTFAGLEGIVRVGDFNGDGLNDLIVSGSPVPATPRAENEEMLPASVMYELRGTGERLTGRHTLGAGQLYRPVGYAAPERLGYSHLFAWGDIDGDGSTDLAAFDVPDPLQAGGSVYLLPGSTPAPD